MGKAGSCQAPSHLVFQGLRLVRFTDPWRSGSIEPGLTSRRGELTPSWLHPARPFCQIFCKDAPGADGKTPTDVNSCASTAPFFQPWWDATKGRVKKVDAPAWGQRLSVRDPSTRASQSLGCQTPTGVLTCFPGGLNLALKVSLSCPPPCFSHAPLQDS